MGHLNRILNHRAFRHSPHDIDNRYIAKDIPFGCHVYHELGQVFGVKTPIIDSMINLANAMIETDYYKSGYTLEYLGLAGKDVEKLNHYLRQA